jgi:hypothetical protein
MLDKLEWRDDRVLFNGVTFLLEGVADRNTPRDGLSFWLHKDRGLLDAYGRFFADYADLKPKRCLELGMWKGGSAVLWAEVLRPSKYVGIDLLDAEGVPSLRQYLQERGMGERIRTYWRTDQADAERLREIVEVEFDGPIDLIIDDASHAYGPTRKSFETLFPYLGPGGAYVIEDWTWHFSPEMREHFPADEPGLFKLLSDLALLMVIAPDLVPRVDVRRPFFIVQRGDLPLSEARSTLESFMTTDFSPMRETPLTHLRRLRRRAARLVRGPRP